VLNESIAAIKSESEHMKNLVEQLLFLARGDSGSQKLTFSKLSLTDMMREVFEESEMIDKKHAWKLDAAPDVTCIGDVDMLKQTARILTDNAAKYTPEGGEIRLRAMYKDGHPCIEVQDTGMGISAQDAAHVFERFYRADPARNGASGGTGLGLSIAKWVVDQHRGYFELFSREGLGTRITVHLPETQF
jgi:signal transduction histidine kinase